MQENINDVKREKGTLKKEAIRNVGDQTHHQELWDNYKKSIISIKDLPKGRKESKKGLKTNDRISPK